MHVVFHDWILIRSGKDILTLGMQRNLLPLLNQQGFIHDFDYEKLNGSYIYQPTTDRLREVLPPLRRYAGLPKKILDSEFHGIAEISKYVAAGQLIGNSLTELVDLLLRIAASEKLLLDAEEYWNPGR